jgi:Rieske Fe-S protein
MSSKTTDPTRRGMLVGSASVALLAGCGATPETAASSASSVAGEASSAASSAASAASSAASEATALASTSEIPVGGCTVFEKEKVVITQSTNGEFRALTAVCTHQGCLVTEVKDGTIICPCHGSTFALDGSVTNGPATEPLTEVPISVNGTSITLG